MSSYLKNLHILCCVRLLCDTSHFGHLIFIFPIQPFVHSIPRCSKRIRFQFPHRTDIWIIRFVVVAPVISFGSHSSVGRKNSANEDATGQFYPSNSNVNICVNAAWPSVCAFPCFPLPTRRHTATSTPNSFLHHYWKQVPCKKFSSLSHFVPIRTCIYPKNYDAKAFPVHSTMWLSCLVSLSKCKVRVRTVFELKQLFALKMQIEWLWMGIASGNGAFTKYCPNGVAATGVSQRRFMITTFIAIESDGPTIPPPPPAGPTHSLRIKWDFQILPVHHELPWKKIES